MKAFELRQCNATKRRLVGLFALAVASLCTGSADAQSQQAQAQQSESAQTILGAQVPYTVTYASRFSIRSDRTATQLSTVRFKILSPASIQSLSQQRLAFVEGMEKLDTVEAYTEKADGRKIPVDASAIMTRDGASNDMATYTHDLKERTIIFPNVEVGDTLVMTNKEETLRGLFPGHFFYADTFPRSVPVASARIVVEAPKSLDLQVKTLGAGLIDTVEETGTMRRHIVELAPRPYAPEEPGAVSPIDRDPSLLISTFKSYEEMGLAYRSAALPKARVTPEIAALADEITRGIEGKRAQAVAIDAWVKKNIRYVALYLSSGRVVPHDAANVLSSKFGDCKDKATLMSALLAAKGVASETVLINAGDAYTLPEPPTMAVLNHAILYLPELDLYADPTVTQAAFGVLAPQSYDKPVVRVSAGGATLARTPAMRPEDHTYHVHTAIRVAADGAVTGRTEESATGGFAASVRAVAAAVQNLGSETAAQRQLQSLNTPGTGRFDLASSGEMSDPVTITGSFALQETLKLPSSGAASIPYGMPLLTRPGNFLLGSRLNGRKSAFPCFAGQQIEDIDATFEPGLSMPAPPISRTIENPAFSYRSSYTVEGRTLKMHREFTSHVPGQSCPAALEAQITEDMKLVRLNMSNTFNFGATAPDPAKQRQIVEVTRAVPADQKRRVDFVYWVNPDCSAPEAPIIRIVEQPKNGVLAVENGTGFTNYPQGNPRFECNKRKSDGVMMVYEPKSGFVGGDSLTVDVIYPYGHSVKRHYSIEVK